MKNQCEFDKKDTLSHLFKEVCLRYKEKTCLIFDEDVYTYEQFYNIVLNLSKNIVSKLGIKKGDRVAIIYPNCKEFIFNYFALFSIGAWVVPINNRWEEPEIANVLEDASIDMIMFAERIGVLDYTKIIRNIKCRLKSLKNLVILRTTEETSGQENEYIDYHSLLEPGDEAVEFEQIYPEDVAMLCYTSGTTGVPKGVMIPHGNYVKTSEYTAQLWKTENEIPLSIAPLYAAQGFLAILIDFTIGSTIYFLSTFNPNQIIKSISKGICSIVHTQPTMWTLLLSSAAIRFANFSALKKVVVSGSVCTPELARKIEQYTGCRLLNGYGLVEATGVVTITRFDDPDDIRINTVGRPIPGVEIKIVDQYRNEVPQGEVGELATRGYLMKGYLSKPEETDGIIDDEGWLYTGDLARYYDDENITIMGRCKDMIIRGGFNIYPVDIEEEILKHPEVLDVSVVGKPHGVMGEQTVAFVVPKPGAAINKNDIRQFCAGKLANYKIPDHIIFISQMPIILAGKVQKSTLREWTLNGVPEENLILFDMKAMCDI